MQFKTIRVRTWYLTFKEAQPRPIAVRPLGFEFGRWRPSSGEYLKAYKSVGGVWGWSQRLLWEHEKLSDYLADSSTQLWHVSLEGYLFGFVELDSRTPGSNEVAYLGLIPAMIGKGLGTDLLRTAIMHAHENNRGKIWLHTCALDHRAALSFYRREGFEIENSRIEEESYPASFLDFHGINENQVIEEGFRHRENFSENS